MAKRIVLIGAGSAVFTRGLVADLILAPEMGPWEIGLVDIDPDALAVAEGLARRMVAARGAEVEVLSSTDRRDLLPGADVVVTTIGVGGRRAWEADVLIPRKYGIYQPVGDTVMPGGISRAMRMVPALVEVARDIAALCPGALYVNYANPMTANCWAIRRATGVPVVGLCHGTFGVIRSLAAFVGAPPDEVQALYMGLNHLTFIYDLRHRGEDLWPRVRETLAAERGGAAPAAFPAAENPFAWSLYDAYGAYPCCNDRHVSEFFPERFPGGRYGERTLGVDAFSFEDTIARGDRTYAAMRAQALGEAPLDERIFQRAAGEHEQLLEILAAMAADTRGVYAANLPNRGAVDGLPDDVILELPCAATPGGLRPLALPDAPPALVALIARRAAATRVVVDAALACDRDLLVQALLVDGAVTELETARALAGELLTAQRRYLPEAWFAGA
jgi:alpha-galactosidase